MDGNRGIHDIFVGEWHGHQEKMGHTASVSDGHHGVVKHRWDDLPF